MNIEQLADLALRARFVLGYPTMLVSGFLLGVIAFGRMRTMTNGRRRLYRLLTCIAFGLAWCGFWGITGIVQYGTIVSVPRLTLKPISLAFSVGIIWLAIWLATLTAVLVAEELRCGRPHNARY